MNPESKYKLKDIVSGFNIYGDFHSAGRYGSGHINDTFLVQVSEGGTPVRYILQRINTNIFKNPEGLMENIARVCRHGISKLRASGEDASRRFLTVISATDGKAFYVDADGNYWRCYIFIELAKTYDVVETEKQAYETAKAFGGFQKLLSDIPGERMVETIPDFHHTPKRYETLLKAVMEDTCNRAKDVKAEIGFFMEREAEMGKLLKLLQDGCIPERITHNDTKLNNVMIDDVSQEGICVIDLDTVMPGLSLYDFGDMVRTTTSPAKEDEKDLSKVTMQMPMFRALAKGFMDAAGDVLVRDEKDNMAFSGKLITMEIGIRFLTDFLQGDTYFKTHREGHNLDRCRTQIKLAQSIETQMDAMNAYVNSL